MVRPIPRLCRSVSVTGCPSHSAQTNCWMTPDGRFQKRSKFEIMERNQAEARTSHANGSNRTKAQKRNLRRFGHHRRKMDRSSEYDFTRLALALNAEIPEPTGVR